MEYGLRVLTLEQGAQWDRIVKSFREHDVYYLSGYVKGFELHGDGKPLLFYYEGRGGERTVRGMNVVMMRDIGAAPYFKGTLETGTYFDLATPYGYGGWLIEAEGEEEAEGKEGAEYAGARGLFEAYDRWCLEQGIVSEFVRFHPLAGSRRVWEEAGGYEVTGLGETVAMDLASPETIWENMSSKNRNIIRKAVKNRVKVYNGRYPEIFEVFRRIYEDTMDRDHAGAYYYFKKGFYQSVLEELPQNAQVFYAMIPDGTVIAAAVILGENGRMAYHLSGSVKAYGSLGAMNLLLYEAALWGSANGYERFYLGGGVGSGEDGLFKFKRSFYRGGLNRFYIGKRVFNQVVYEELVQIRCRETAFDRETAYFPAYRAYGGGKPGVVCLKPRLLLSGLLCQKRGHRRAA